MKRIITDETFDLLHYGHINLLRRVKVSGDYLVVALSTDEFNYDIEVLGEGKYIVYVASSFKEAA